MFKTLYSGEKNTLYFIIYCILLRTIFLNISWWSYFSILVFSYQFMLLFSSLGILLPTRHLCGSLMCLQFLIGPTFAYNGLDVYQYFTYRMQIPESDYFSYVLPCVMLFIFGLNLNSNNRGEKININLIHEFYNKRKFLAYNIVIVGFFSDFISGNVSGDFKFVFFLLSNFKFVGLLLIILGEKKINYTAIFLVVGSIVSSSFSSGMFHDLLTWSMYLISVVAIKWRFSFFLKITGFIIFIISISLIQVMKGTYRSEIYKNNEEAGVSKFAELYNKENENEKEKNGIGLLNFENLAKSNVRINQGYIITNIMTQVPAKVDFENGSELWMILQSAILPRIIAPNKLNAGDKKIFTKYSGIVLNENTSMGLSSVGDGYINFGKIGGVIFMFFLGIAYSGTLKLFDSYSKIFPVILLFIPLIFYYPIRPDCELQTILGHLVKSTFLVILIFSIWASYFKLIKVEHS